MWLSRHAFKDIFAEYEAYGKTKNLAKVLDDQAVEAIKLIKKIRVSEELYKVDPENPRLRQTTSQKMLGDMFLAVALPSILGSKWESVKRQIEAHFDASFDEIVAAAVVPRRNGKSTKVIRAALAIIENVPGYTIEITATSEKQAKFALAIGKAMVAQRFGPNTQFYECRDNKIIIHHGDGLPDSYIMATIGDGNLVG